MPTEENDMRTTRGNYVTEAAHGGRRCVGIVSRTKGGWRPVIFFSRQTDERRERTDWGKPPVYIYEFTGTLRLPKQRKYKDALAAIRGEYADIMVPVKNVMSGATVMERIDIDWCCSVASETYWSM